jgi:purine nucleosidase
MEPDQSPRPIIIDCDPGVDDAIAILLALASSEELDLLGITCVAGNVPLAQTQANARRICELAGRTDIRVFAGCERPILRPPYADKSSHGDSGLGAAQLPEPTMPLQTEHAVDFIIESCLDADDEGITLCPIGPLTNIALAIVKDTRIISKIREIVLMGGAALSPGNVTPVAEFNVFVDPHAAQIVFASGAKITMFGLDATYQALVTPERTASIEALSTAVSSNVVAMLDFYGRYNVEKFGGPGGPLHDPCVIAYLINMNLFSGKAVAVTVEVASEMTMGQTVTDWWGVTDAEPNCTVINHVDAEGLFTLLTARLSRY